MTRAEFETWISETWGEDSLSARVFSRLLALRLGDIGYMPIEFLRNKCADLANTDELDKSFLWFSSIRLLEARIEFLSPDGEEAFLTLREFENARDRGEIEISNGRRYRNFLSDCFLVFRGTDDLRRLIMDQNG